MRFTVRTLLFLMLLVGAICSGKVNGSHFWIRVLLVFISTAVFHASFELDNRHSRLVYWVNWLMLIGAVAAAAIVYQNSVV